MSDQPKPNKSGNFRGTHPNSRANLTEPWTKETRPDGGARERKTLRAHLQHVLDEQITSPTTGEKVSKRELLARVLVDEALKSRNHQAIRELLAREYPATQQVEMTGQLSSAPYHEPFKSAEEIEAANDPEATVAAPERVQ